MTVNKRVYAQYADKPKAVDWYNITPELSDNIVSVFNAVRNSYDIDSAYGEQLNVIGRVVDIDRSHESFLIYEPATVFGADVLESQFGGDGAQFQGVGANFIANVSDAVFRVLIKAKIAKNNSDATIDGITKSLGYIASATPITIVDNEDMTFSVSFGSELTDIERFVFNTFDVLPRPQCVRFLGYTEETAITQWGGAMSWGDTRANFGIYFGA